MISEEDRRYLKADISIFSARKGTHYEFCCLRAIPGDGVYFIAWSGRVRDNEKAKHFKILKYSWSGKLERITAGTLPFPFITLGTPTHITKGPPSHYYGKLKIGKEHYFFPCWRF